MHDCNQRRTPRRFFRSVLILVANVIGCSVALLATPATARAAASITLTNISSSCNSNAINFRRTDPLGPSGKYELFRKETGGSYTRVKVVQGGVPNNILDTNFLPATGRTLTYYIRATPAGSTTAVQSNALSVVASASKCKAPTRMKVRLLRVSCDNAGLLSRPTGPDIFDTTAGAVSVANYFNEVSNGQFSFEGEDEVRTFYLSSGVACGTSYDPNVPASASGSNRGRWIGPYPAAFYDDVRTLIEYLNDDDIGKPDHWLVVTNRALASLGGGLTADAVPVSYIGGGAFNDPDDYKKGFRDIIHEVGHSLGLWHAGSLRCTNTAFPRSWNIDSTCRSDPSNAMTAYGDWTDPMGVSGWHFNAYHKHLLGWIPTSDVRTVFLSSEEAYSNTVTLRDAAWADGPRLIKINYNSGTEYFFLEYRRPLGYNASGMLGDDSRPMSASVFITYVPTRALTCGAVTPCMDGGDQPVSFLPGRNPDVPLIRMDKEPYWDPHRKIRITMLARSGRDTTLRIEHEVE
jgi:hypothetical protein